MDALHLQNQLKKEHHQTVEILFAPSKYPYIIPTTLVTTKSLTLKSWYKTNTTILKVKDKGFLVRAVDSNKPGRRSLKFQRLILDGPIVDIQTNNTDVYIFRCNISNAGDFLVKAGQDKTLKINLHLTHVVCTDCLGIAHFKSLALHSVVNIEYSKFNSRNLQIKSTGVVVEDITTRMVFTTKDTTFTNYLKSFEVHSAKKNCSQKINLSKFNIKDSNFLSNNKAVEVLGCFTISIQNVLFSKNQGGALRLGRSTHVNIDNVSFLENTKEGALRLDNVAMTVITNSRFQKNEIKTIGGAIWAYQARVDIKDTIFEKNVAKTTGSAIYHRGRKCLQCRLKLTNVILRNLPQDISQTGIMIQSNGLVVLDDVNANLELNSILTIQKPHIAAIKSDYAIMLVQNQTMTLNCPRKYMAKLETTTIQHTTKNGTVITQYAMKTIMCKECSITNDKCIPLLQLKNPNLKQLETKKPINKT